MQHNGGLQIDLAMVKPYHENDRETKHQQQWQQKPHPHDHTVTSIQTDTNLLINFSSNFRLDSMRFNQTLKVL